MIEEKRKSAVSGSFGKTDETIKSVVEINSKVL